MKSILNLFGIAIIGATVPLSIASSISDNNTNNSSINNKLLKEARSCGDELLNSYDSGVNEIGWPKKTMYVDQWLVNAHYDWATREDTGRYNFNRVQKFLDYTIPGFAEEDDEHVKELITKTFMTESLKYENKSISGFFITVNEKYTGMEIQYGIFDSWRNLPENLPGIPAYCQPWSEAMNWNNQKKIDDDGWRSTIGMPKYDRYGDIDTIKSDFDYFSLPEAEMYYYFTLPTKERYAQSLSVEWTNKVFSTNYLSETHSFILQSDNFKVNHKANKLEMNVSYHAIVQNGSIRMQIYFKVKATALQKNSNTGFDISYGDHFNLFNIKTEREVLQDFEKAKRQLPPEEDNRRLSKLGFAFKSPSDFWFALNINHQLLNVMWAHYDTFIAENDKQVLLSVFNSIFGTFDLWKSQYKDYLINTLMDTIANHFSGGLHDLVDTYRPARENSDHGVTIFVSNDPKAGWKESILPWNRPNLNN
ncbi:hypothetical protein [Spiroplasma monobiae]|uniref:Uncharacterized protein n=1 Tax=Spiroplasma monobiae MQ-1 TaxID=1336748 RepID=A0A2K9LWD8_SPISQ|nr:hypothetical protein [Spiroplasma monobiae]AUM62705.1 hypothetical protein SMONO_v1c04560 [Spiroplasma monobiae MQ-1]